ncbi:MAG: ROK family protein [Mycoplasmataceae bacterium]|nr:ROK family protein [Mycoplasmataceae bacterium]
MNNYAAIDIGGTNSRFAIIKDDKVIFRESFPTNLVDPIESMKPLISLLNQHTITNLGICLPGVANYDEGIIISGANIPNWVNFNMKNFILTNTKVEKIVFENDANAMAYAVHSYYKKTKKDITQFFTISTGLGAGLVYKDEIYSGYSFQGLEIAWMPASFNKEKNHLSTGSCEYFSSGSGIEKRANKIFGKSLTTKEVFDLYNKDDKAKDIIDEAIETLGSTLAIVISIANPNTVVIGGSVARNNKWYIDAAIAWAKKNSLPSQFNVIEFLDDPYGDDCALFGIDALAKKK